MPAAEKHYINRVGWLRAAVLGANDGLISTASLVVGVAAASTGKGEVIIAGLAGLIAGAMSMAAGEYVSVSSQADTEKAEIRRERKGLEANPEGELEELTQIWQERGLAPELAKKVAKELTKHDALGAHLRDELGLADFSTARPLQAALVSALTFALGAFCPLAATLFAPLSGVLWLVGSTTVVALMVLGALGAWLGGAPMRIGAIRVTLWGVLAMAATTAVGSLFGAVV